MDNGEKSGLLMYGIFWQNCDIFMFFITISGKSDDHFVESLVPYAHSSPDRLAG